MLLPEQDLTFGHQSVYYEASQTTPRQGVPFWSRKENRQEHCPVQCFTDLLFFQSSAWFWAIHRTGSRVALS